MLGYFRVIKLNEHEVVKTKSISFERMDQIQFTDFYDRAIKSLIKYNYLPEDFKD